jgi:cytoskeletal protein RodZ
MSIYKKNTSKVTPKGLIVVAVIILLIASGAAFAIHRKNSNIPQTTQPTVTQRKAQAKADLDAKRTITEATPSKTATTPPVSTAPGTSADQPIDLSAKTESNNSVTVIAKLANISSGTCKLDIANGTSTFSASADVIYQPEYSSCAGFSVPITPLGHGTWNITLTINPGTTQSTKTIIYKVQ